MVALARRATAPAEVSTDAESHLRQTGTKLARGDLVGLPRFRKLLHSVRVLGDTHLDMRVRVRTHLDRGDRARVWTALIVGPDTEEDITAAYTRVLSDVFGGIDVTADAHVLPAAPPLDDTPSFGGALQETDWAAEHGLSPDEFAAVRRVLCALAHVTGREDCPPICDACAALTQELPEPLVFSACVRLLARSDHLEPRTDVQAVRIVASNATAAARAKSLRHAFADLVTARCSRLAVHLDNLGCDLASLSTVWFDRLYVGTLPYETALRVFDTFLLEGSKVRPAYQCRRGQLEGADRPIIIGNGAADTLVLTDRSVLPSRTCALQLRALSLIHPV